MKVTRRLKIYRSIRSWRNLPLVRSLPLIVVIPFFTLVFIGTATLAYQGIISQNNAINLDQGLVGHWKFDGNSLDSSGSGNHGWNGTLGQAGTFTAMSGEWVTIEFNSSYIDPVVVGVRNSVNGRNGLVFEAQNVTRSSAQVRLCAIDGINDGCYADTTEETGAYMVIDAGRTGSYPGIDAGKTTASGSFQGNPSTVSFNESFSTNPYVFGAIQTTNGPHPIEMRVSSVSTTQFSGGICKHASENGCSSSVSETIGWVAIDSTSFPFEQLGETGDVSTNGSAWGGVSFSQSYSENPVIIAKTQGDVGAQEVQISEVRNVTTTGTEVRFCENDTTDTCDSHSTNANAWMAIQAGPLTPVSGSTAPSLAKDRFGNPGKAYNFDGSNDWLSMSDSRDIGVAEEMTLSFWFNADNDGSNQYLFDNRSPGSWWLIKDYGGGSCGSYTNNICFEGRVYAQDSDWDPGQWHHLVLRESASESTMYIDGELVASGSGESLEIATNLRAGTRYSNAGFYDGKMDEVRLYSRMLNESEIDALYNSQSQPSLTAVSNLQKDLLGHWKFNGDAKDATPYSNHGTVTGATLANGREGNSGSAYSFDGDDDVVNAGVIPEMDFTTDDFSISLWVNPDDFSISNSRIINRGNYQDSGWEVFVTGSGSVVLRTYQNGQLQNVSSSSSLDAGAWNHVVITRSGSDGSFYINGQASGGGSSIQDPTTYSGDLHIGNYPSNNSYDFKGDIDDVRIYGRVLAQNEAQQLYDQYQPTISLSRLNKGLTGRWSFDGDAKDRTPYVQHGNVNGGILLTGDRNGRADSAYSFDGVDDYIRITNPTAYTTNEFTWSAWIYPENDTSDRMLLGADSVATAAYYFRLVSDERLHFSVHTQESSQQTLSGANSLSLQEWHHVVALYDGANLKLYVNGQLDNEKAISETLNPWGLDRIGRWRDSDPRSFTGKMDDVRIYNRALGEAEIERLHETY